MFWMESDEKYALPTLEMLTRNVACLINAQFLVRNIDYITLLVPVFLRWNNMGEDKRA